MKKTLSALLSIVMVFSILMGLSVPVYADSVYEAGSYKYRVLDDGTAEIVSCLAYSENHVIPERLDRYTVTSIGVYAFEDIYVQKYMKSVTIPGCVKNIGDSAFADCYNLIKVVMSDGVKNIGARAFDGCYRLKYVTIPDSVTSIGVQAFWECTGLTDIIIPDSVTEIGEQIFRGCSSLKNVKLSNSITTISKSAFYSCVNLTSVTGGEKVKHIDVQAFDGCKILKNLFLPAGITNIDYNAFNSCDNLADVYFCGDESAWNNILIEAGNEHLTQANMHFHKWNNGAVTKVPTCAEKGVKTYTCDICKETKTEYIPVTEHNYTETVVAPTCKTEGYILHSCSNCKAYYKTDFVPVTSHSYKNTVTKATLTQNGKIENKCNGCGDVKKTTTIYAAKTIKLNRNVITTNGTVQRPTVTVTDSKGKALTYKKDFVVEYSNFNSKNVGRYTVTVKLIGNYSGTKTFPYYINPKPTEFVPSNKGGFKAISRGFTIKWNKQASQTTGYQIQYATKRDFSNAATITIANPNTTSYTSKGRAGNTRYYVRVRTYKKIGTGTFYSSWNSGVKSVVTLR